MDHEKHMNRAIELARRNPDAPFGCVIADVAGEVVAEGVNDADRSPILHGETAAIIQLFDRDPGADPSNLTLYTTAEPCPMCSGAMLWSGIPRLYYGTSVVTLKGLGLDHIDLACEEVSHRCSFASFEAEGGLLERECDALFEELAQRPGV
ncbi:nucleoside deaminase [Rubrobacter aplysinae]|uniref:nucleoside deaminase n=1 Tax=Rubrobacter aplysinae TaxID=909625 RepID=UPI00064BD805|nr:nucleoside deaminase [Rubrobacter aplysinae]